MRIRSPSGGAWLCCAGLAIVAALAPGASAACDASDSPRYECMLRVPGGGDAALYWTWAANATVSIALRVRARGYVAVGFPEVAGAMQPAHIIAGVEGEVEPYWTGTRDGDTVVIRDDTVGAVLALRGGALETDGNYSTLRFRRTTAGLEGMVGVNLAWHHEDTRLQYHTARVPLRIDFEAGTRAPVAACTPSDFGGYACMVASPLPGVRIHWSWAADRDTIRFAIRAKEQGWLAMSFPARAGDMWDADAVVFSNGSVTPYSLAVLHDGQTDIAVDAAVGRRLGITNTSGVREGGYTVLEFTRDAAGLDRPIPVNLAASASNVVLSYHTVRTAMVVDFFEGTRVPLHPCVPAEVPGFACSLATPVEGVKLLWTWDGLSKDIRLGVVSNSSGWLSMAFPEHAGHMMPAAAVVYANDTAPAAYSLTTMDEYGNAPNASVAAELELSDAAGTRVGGTTVLSLVRSAAPFASGGSVGVNVAWGGSAGAAFGGYHGRDHRVALAVDLMAEPPTVCVASPLRQYTCTLGEVLPGASLHWAWVYNKMYLNMTVLSRTEGYLAVAFPEEAGKMNPADAVVFDAAAVQAYRLGYYPGIANQVQAIPDEDAGRRMGLYYPEGRREGNYTKLTFTRSANGFQRPVAVNIARHWNRTLFGYHDTSAALLVDFPAGRRLPLDGTGGVPQTGCLPSSRNGYDCATVTGLEDTALHWRIDEAAGRVHLAVVSEGSQGWLAVGFPASAGRMVPADALVYGADSVDAYRLSSYVPDGVTADAAAAERLGSTNLRGVRVGGATLMEFTLPLGAFDGAVALNFARDTGRAALSPHGAGAVSGILLDIRSAEDVAVVLSALEDLTDHRLAHGWLMVVAWCYVAPAGIITKRYGKVIFGAGNAISRQAGIGIGGAFIGHVAAMLTAVACAAAGFAVAVEKFSRNNEPDPDGHNTAGYVAFAVMVAMPLLGAVGPLVVPKHDAPGRKVFKAVHGGCGAALLLVAYYQVFSGVRKARDLYVPGADALESAATVGVVVAGWTVLLLEALQHYYIVRSKKRYAMKSYSLDKIRAEEVAQHGRESGDPWVAVRGRVFAIKAWMVSHPGGVEVLLESAGQDATEAWELFRHSSAAMKKMETFYVGEVEDVRMASAMDLAEDIGHALVSLNLPAAAELINAATEAVPHSLLDTYIRLLDNLESYLPYLPRAVVDASEASAHQAQQISPEQLQLAYTIESNPPTEVAIAFTDIQSSTQLWEGCPAGMKIGLETHNAALRAVIATTSGYEVKTIGDAFMVAFLTAKDAFAFALAAQEALVDAAWPEDLLQSHELCHPLPGGGGKTGRLWAGPRVRIGVHWGEVEGQKNPITGRCDFFGNPVNKAARVEAIGVGGCSAVTQEVLDAISEEERGEVGSVDYTPLGRVPLKGVSEDNLSHITLILPAALAARKALALEVFAQRNKPKAAPRTGPREALDLFREQSKRSVPSPRARRAYKASMATVAVLDVDFSHATAAYHVGDAVEEFVTPVLAFSARTHGVLQSWTGGVCVLSWNVSKTCTEHGVQALKFLTALHAAGWHALGRCQVWGNHVACGLASGWTVNGSAGNDTHRLFMLIGPPLPLAIHAAAVARRARTFAVTAGADAALLNALRLLDRYFLAGRDEAVLMHELDMAGLTQNEESWGFPMDQASDATWGVGFNEMYRAVFDAAPEVLAERIAAVKETVASVLAARACGSCNGTGLVAFECDDCERGLCRECIAASCENHDVAPSLPSLAGLDYVGGVLARAAATGTAPVPAEVPVGLDLPGPPAAQWLHGDEPQLRSIASLVSLRGNPRQLSEPSAGNTSAAGSPTSAHGGDAFPRVESEPSPVPPAAVLKSGTARFELNIT
eukprot:TRINITY_DN4203_c0_g1_i1.p1 TRINITY_DN4203_c0_g1~~TRINITY_DN4203_c0_g1_i1.p1  ORF type:complete len:1857 (+),score=437.95 TRINITY_DN4203_c0_g1_i1:54-5624(+)